MKNIKKLSASFAALAVVLSSVPQAGAVVANVRAVPPITAAPGLTAQGITGPIDRLSVVAPETLATASLTASAAVAAPVTIAEQPGTRVGQGLLARTIRAVLSGRRIFDTSVSRETPAPVFGALGLREHKPIVLPNKRGTDDHPTIPSPDREATIRVEAYALPGGRDVGDIPAEKRRVLDADPKNTDSVVKAIRAFVDADRARFGISSADLQLISVKRFEGHETQADSIFVYFRQIRDGLVVNGSNLSFTVKVLNDKPTLLAESGTLFPSLEVNTGTVLDDRQVWDRISERTGWTPSEASQHLAFVEEKIVYAQAKWRHVKIYATDGMPVENLPLMIAVDMVDGLTFAWDNRSGVESTAGTTSGLGVVKGPQMPDSKIEEIPLPFLELKIGGKSYVTDKHGEFKVDPLFPITSDLELTGTLSGPYVRIEDKQQKTLTIRMTIKAGDSKVKVVFNPGTQSDDENTKAQVMAFQTVNRALNFLRERGLTNERMDKLQLPVRSNINQDCNAYYTPGRASENFFRSSSRCRNTSYDSVSQHETGHYWHDFTVGIADGGLSEGWGDILSMFDLDNPIIGEHFLKTARNGHDYVRHGVNDYKYNEYDEVHDKGQAWGGFGWRLRTALIAKLGQEKGRAVAEALILPTMFAGSADIPKAIAQVLINATQKDGTIMHEAEIREAASHHGVDLPKKASDGLITTSWASMWTDVHVVAASVESVPQAGLSEQSAPIRPNWDIDAAPESAEGVVFFQTGRLVGEDVLRYVRGYLDHFGVQYKLRQWYPPLEPGNSYKLKMTGPRKALENITKKLKSGALGL